MRWWRVRTVREKLQAEIDEVDRKLGKMVRQVPREHRGRAAFQSAMDDLLKQRSALMAQRDAGFKITDRRKVRG